jgi:predicted DsbA family dithiol-disulfide isomerase
MEEGRVRAFVDTDEGVAEVREELRRAGENGITAVPTLAFGNGRVLVGAQDSLTYLDALEGLATDADRQLRREDVQVSAERACT